MNPVSPKESQRILADLGVPISDETGATINSVPPDDLWRYGASLINSSVAAQVWQDWHPGDQRCEQEPFKHAFGELLVEAFTLGLRLDRFREMSARLPDPNNMKQWIEAFEACIASDDFGAVRLTVSHEQFDDLQASNRRSNGDPTWDALLERTSDEIFEELGLIYPPPRVEPDTSLESPWFRLNWNDLTMPPIRGLGTQEVFVEETIARLALLNIRGEEAVHPLTGTESAIINASHAEIAQQAGLATWKWQEYLRLYLSGTIRRAAGAFVNRRLYDLYSLRLGEFSPVLLNCLENRFAAPFVVQVLRALISEGISVRNLSEVFRAMLELRSLTNVNFGKYIVFPPPTGGVGPNSGAATLAEMTPQYYADFVRTALKRQISYFYSRGATLIVYLLDPDAERRFARGLAPAERRAFMEAVREELGSLPHTTQAPVVLTTIEIRRQVWRLMFPEFPRVAVLSYQELSPDLNIQPIARISPEF